MAFPTTALPVTVEIAPGADPAGDPGTWTWVDITSSVRLRYRIHITQGRADESARVAPSTCRLRLDNRSGNFTPRNPLGAYYGTLGRNTPLRVAIRRAEDPFTRTESSGWGTEPLWGETWTVTGTASDYSVSSGTARQSLGSTGTLRQSFVDLGGPNARVTVDVTCPVVPTGASITHWVAARAADVNNYYVALLEISTTGTVNLRLRSRVGGTLSANLTSASVGTHSAGNTWRVMFECVGTGLRAKAWKTSDSEPTAWQVEVTDTDLTAGTQVGVLSGRTGGNTNGTVVIEWDNFTVDLDRFNGFVSSWPPRWDKSGRDATVPIEANGLLRRLGQGTPPSQSPMRRTVAASDPVAYWPVEDGGDAGQVGSAFSGHPSMAMSGTVLFGQVGDYVLSPGNNLEIGTAPLADLKDGGSLTATVPASVTAACASAWAIQALAITDFANASGDITLLEWTTPGGTYVRWQLKIVQSTVHTQVIGYNSAGTPTTIIDHNGVTGAPANMRVTAEQSGGNITVELYLGEDFFFDTASVAGTLAGPVQITANATGTTNTNNMAFGHLVLWSTASPVFPLSSYTDSYGVSVRPVRFSYRNEAAHDRLARLCAAEEGVSLTMPAVSAGFVTRMGSQPVGTFLDLLYECAEADQGVIYEDGFGLGYKPREARYNRPVGLALGFDTGQIAEPPEPADDDQQLRNRWKVSRTGGSSAVAEDADSIATHGLYKDEVTVNHVDDTQLYDHAVWRVHLGT